jgi:hypothetical protein
MVTKTDARSGIRPTPDPEARRLARKALTAAATRLRVQKLDRRQMIAAYGSSEWQSDAWDVYDLVGEMRFLADTLAARESQARLYIGRVTESDQFGEPEPVSEDSPENVLHLLGSESEIQEMLETYGVNQFVTGDGWMVGVPRHFLDPAMEVPDNPDLFIDPFGDEVVQEPSIEDLTWHFLSVDEISFGDGTISLEWECEAATNGVISLAKDQVYAFRVWRPHPRRRREANSPVRAALPVLRELVGLTMHVSAQIDSRLAGAGVMFMLQNAASDIAGPNGEDMPFDEALVDAMVTPIKDRAAAGAVAPLVSVIPDDGTDRAASDYVHLQTFSQALDPEARELRRESIERAAMQLDAPPELLLGTAGSNHWGAWLIREDTITTHVNPPVERFVNALTQQFLWPVLEARGKTPEQAREFVVWYSTRHLITRPNRTTDALAVFKEGQITGDALRRESGFNDSDAPDMNDSDPAVDMVLALVSGSPQLAVNPGLPELLRQVRAILDGEGAPEPPALEPVEEEAPEIEDVEDEEDVEDTDIPDTIDDAPLPGTPGA